MLNTSERTLKRRLGEEGSTFRDLSQLARQARAESLIANAQLTLTEIAAELGFSDLSSFSQAFKRWTGRAPSLARPME
jgi:AraC-like DNA-binding protein